MIQEQDFGYVAPDGQGGMFVVWPEERINTSTGTDIYLQHVFASGALDPRWPASGLPVCIQPDLQSPAIPIADGSGGVMVWWYDYRSGPSDLYAKRYTAAGQLVDGWAADGSPVCTASGDQDPQSICPDGTGGAYFAWDDYRDGTSRARVIHLEADGSVAAGWPSSGKLLITDTSVESGATRLVHVDDGAIAVWADSRGQTALGVNIFAIRLTPSGELYPEWSAAGTPVLTSGTSYEVRKAVGDGAGGVFVGWDDNRVGRSPPAPFDYDLYAQHILGNGTVDSRWPTNGVAVCNAPNGQYDFGMASDGFGGVQFVWEDERSVTWQTYAQRILADGSVAPGWPPNGRLASTSSVTKFVPSVVADGTGGLYAFWVEYPSSGFNRVFGQHFLADGSLDGLWGPAGLVIADGGGIEGISEPHIVSDGFGGAVMAYTRSNLGAPWIRVYALRIEQDGPVPTLLSLADYDIEPGRVTLRWQTSDAASLTATVERSDDGVSWNTLGTPRLEGTDLLVYEDTSVPAGRFAYRLTYLQGSTPMFTNPVWMDVPAAGASLALEGFHPNPAPHGAAIAFSLPDALPASLQIHDVRGRLVYSREVGSLGPGPHLARVDVDGGVSPGVYWVRLVRADQVLNAKGVVIR